MVRLSLRPPASSVLRPSRLSCKKHDHQDDHQKDRDSEQAGDQIAADIVILQKAVVILSDLYIPAADLLRRRILEVPLDRHFLLVVTVKIFLTVLVHSINHAVFRRFFTAVFPNPAVDRMLADIDGAFHKAVRKGQFLGQALRRQDNDGPLGHTDRNIRRKDSLLRVINEEVAVSILIRHIKEDRSHGIGSGLNLGALIGDLGLGKALRKSGRVKASRYLPGSLVHRYLDAASNGIGLRGGFFRFLRCFFRLRYQDRIGPGRRSVLRRNLTGYRVFPHLQALVSADGNGSAAVIGGRADGQPLHIRRDRNRVFRRFRGKSRA